MAHIYSTWPPLFVSNGPLGPYFWKAGQNTTVFRFYLTISTIHVFFISGVRSQSPVISFTPQSSPSTTVRGGTMSLKCDYSSFSQTVISYELIRDTIKLCVVNVFQSQEKVDVSYNSSIVGRVTDVDYTFRERFFTLHYNQTTCEDEGSYTCRISFSDTGIEIRDSLALNVTVKGKTFCCCYKTHWI